MRNKGHGHEIFRCYRSSLRLEEPLNTHVNVCTRASIDPVNVERVVLSERGHRRSVHTRTRAQLRSDTRTTSCALTGCRADPDVHEAIEMTTVLFTEHLFYFPLDPPRGHTGWARITIRFQRLSKYGSCPTNGNTNVPPDQIHM